MGFNDKTRTKVLLWSDRHCCICKKPCGINIEVHHVVPKEKGGKDNIDNAIPLCFDCHSDVERYNEKHPKGTKFKYNEQYARRDQVYEEFTRHLVPPIHARITQDLSGDKKRNFPDVGFILSHFGDSLPVKVRVIIESKIGRKLQILPYAHYSGKKTWNLNPRVLISGHFKLPENLVPKKRAIELRVTLKVIDQFEREHSHLPAGFIHDKGRNLWYTEP